jgi:hypothetical protein
MQRGRPTSSNLEVGFLSGKQGIDAWTAHQFLSAFAPVARRLGEASSFLQGFLSRQYVMTQPPAERIIPVEIP